MGWRGLDVESNTSQPIYVTVKSLSLNRTESLVLANRLFLDQTFSDR